MKGRIWLPAAVLVLGGCAVAYVAAGAAAAFGAIRYTENGAYRDFHKDLDTTWNATVRAMRELGYAVGDNVPHGPTSGEVQVRDHEGENTRVRVSAHPENFCRVEVKIGTFNSENHRRKAALILNKVAELLGE